MLSASIDQTKLNALIVTLRQSSLPLKERLKLIEDFLRVTDIIRQRDTSEQLVCIKHALEVTGHANHSSLYRRGPRLGIKIFRVCCRDFFDKAELETVPRNKGTRGRQKQVKVGMN